MVVLWGYKVSVVSLMSISLARLKAKHIVDGNLSGKCEGIYAMRFKRCFSAGNTIFVIRLEERISNLCSNVGSPDSAIKFFIGVDFKAPSAILIEEWYIGIIFLSCDFGALPYMTNP